MTSWTQDRFDEWLNEWLACPLPVRLDDSPRSQLWRWATREEGCSYLPGPLREWRGGLPWTPLEKRVLFEYIFGDKAKGRRESPDEVYAAVLLQRPLEEITAMRRVHSGPGLLK